MYSGVWITWETTNVRKLNCHEKPRDTKHYGYNSVYIYESWGYG